MMNGAQVTSIVGLVASVSSGEIPAETGINLLQVAFGLDEATAAGLIGDAGENNGNSPEPEKL